MLKHMHKHISGLWIFLMVPTPVVSFTVEEKTSTKRRKARQKEMPPTLQSLNPPLGFECVTPKDQTVFVSKQEH